MVLLHVLSTYALRILTTVAICCLTWLVSTLYDFPSLSPHLHTTVASLTAYFKPVHIHYPPLWWTCNLPSATILPELEPTPAFQGHITNEKCDSRSLGNADMRQFTRFGMRAVPILDSRR